MVFWGFLWILNYWKDIYPLPRKITFNRKHHSFQYKILNKVLYLNKLLFKFGKVKSPLCLFCKSAEETIIHLFSESLCVPYIWNQTQIFFSGCIAIPDVIPQSGILGFIDASIEQFSIINLLSLIYKCYLNKARGTQNLCYFAFKDNVII